MSIRVVLTMSPFSNHVFSPPIQLAYLKGYLQQDKDVEVRILDLETYCYRSALINRNPLLYWQKLPYAQEETFFISKKNRLLLDKMIGEILAQRPDVVGFSVTNTNNLFTRYVSQQIKKIAPEVYIIYGGRRFCHRQKWRSSIAALHKDMPDVDCIVKNEGEATLGEIVAILKTGRRPEYCKGATLRLKGQIVDGGDRPLIENIDSIPFPDISDFTRQDYLSDYIRILFSRGCIGRCSFCGDNDTMGEAVRYRSTQNILDEIRLRMRQGYRRFQTCDLCLNSDVSHLAEICKAIVAERLDIEFIFGQLRHSPELTKDIFSLFRQAGFKAAVFGTESGSQIILNKMRKGVAVQTIERNVRDAHQSGLQVVLMLMVGFPGETEQTSMETINLLRRNKDYIDTVCSAAPTEICGGTPIHDNLKDYDINIKTVFKAANSWESKDGSNCYEWRLDLSKRIEYCLADLEIPLASFKNEGSPTVPKLALRVHKPTVKIKQKFSAGRYANLFKNKRRYSADLHICDTPQTKYAKFLLKITNNGKREWKRKGADYIRAGCRIFDAGGSSNSPVLELRQDLPRGTILKGETFYIIFLIDTENLAKGTYQAKFDMVNEHKFWFEDLGFLPVIGYIESY